MSDRQGYSGNFYGGWWGGNPWPPPSRWRRLRWKVGDFVGRWISPRFGTWIEGRSW